jgi:hypothetical protein
MSFPFLRARPGVSTLAIAPLVGLVAASPLRASGEEFYRRSQPLRNGSRLAFDIRGSVLVTRQ